MKKTAENDFDKEQLELLLNDLQDIDKFTGFKNGAFKYELGKYQASLLVNYIKKQKEVIDNAVKYIDNLRDESAERQGFYNCFTDDLYIADINELLDILKEVSE